MINRSIFICLFFIAFSGCYRVPEKIEPQINYKEEENFINSIKPAFTSLTKEEKETNWGKEYLIALSFAKDLDLYRAVTTFKRALILLEDQDEMRKIEIQYNILLCFFFARKYDQVIAFFEKSELDHLDASFRIFHDLLIVLYTSYQQIGDLEKADQIFTLIEKHYPKNAHKLQLSTSLLMANNKTTKELAQKTPYEKDITYLLQVYEKEKKSIAKAQGLNAVLPGAGYLYLGQKKSAVTSFLINSLFIFAAYQFFHHKYIAAGIITTSFEAGWYFGGIYGAGLEARYYNEKIYEKIASPFMNHHKLFPIFMIQYGF